MPKELSFYPHPRDPMWNAECEAIMKWFDGEGVDVGASVRSVYEKDLRVDMDPSVEPDVLCPGDALQLPDDKYDYLYGIHVFEHFEDQTKLMLEWKRVIKKGGIIAIVHPDVQYTGRYTKKPTDPDYDPYYVHYHERTYAEFLQYLKDNDYFGMKLIDDGLACPEWSFYVILKKV